MQKSKVRKKQDLKQEKKDKMSAELNEAKLNYQVISNQANKAVSPKLASTKKSGIGRVIKQDRNLKKL